MGHGTLVDLHCCARARWNNDIACSNSSIPNLAKHTYTNVAGRHEVSMFGFTFSNSSIVPIYGFHSIVLSATSILNVNFMYVGRALRRDEIVRTLCAILYFICNFPSCCFIVFGRL